MCCGALASHRALSRMGVSPPAIRFRASGVPPGGRTLPQRALLMSENGHSGVGKESCWEGNDRDASSPMSSNVDAVEIVRTSGKPIRQVANELGIYDSTLGNWVRQDEINRGEREGLRPGGAGRAPGTGCGRTPGCGRGHELEKTSCGVAGEGV